VGWICALILATALAAPAGADDWPHWRGPQRTDITIESSRWDDGAWPLGDPAWTADVGVGGSSPVAGAGRVYTLGRRDDEDLLECRDAVTGGMLWRRSHPCAKYGRYHKGDEGQYYGPSSTPALDLETGLLYTLSIDGDLNCRDTAREGEHVWGLNLYEEFGIGQRPDVGGGRRDYGYTTAPLVYGEWLIVEVGASAGNLMAFDKRTGERIWASECTDPAGHTAGLVPLEVEGVPCVAVLTLHRLLVARLDPGREAETVAAYDWETDFANSIASPAAHGDSIIITSGYSQSRSARVRVTLAGAELVWESDQYSKVCTPIIHGGHVYFAWRKLTCLDWKTGKLRWAGGTFGDDASAILTADERLIVLGNRRLALCESATLSPNTYTELALRQGVGSARCWPHVALADGRIYARDLDGHLLCFDLAP